MEASLVYRPVAFPYKLGWVSRRRRYYLTKC